MIELLIILEKDYKIMAVFYIIFVTEIIMPMHIAWTLYYQCNICTRLTADFVPLLICTMYIPGCTSAT